MPVIFDFHGYQEPGQLQVTLSGLGTYGQAAGFVTITPWINNRSNPYWLSSVGSSDTLWFGDLLTHVEATACVDENRVFVLDIRMVHSYRRPLPASTPGGLPPWRRWRGYRRLLRAGRPARCR